LKSRLTQQHEKELSKLQTKLAKYENGREELIKEKNESNKEVAGLKSEIREFSTFLVSYRHPENQTHPTSPFAVQRAFILEAYQD